MCTGFDKAFVRGQNNVEEAHCCWSTYPVAKLTKNFPFSPSLKLCRTVNDPPLSRRLHTLAQWRGRIDGRDGRSAEAPERKEHHASERATKHERTNVVIAAAAAEAPITIAPSSVFTHSLTHLVRVRVLKSQSLHLHSPPLIHFVLLILTQQAVSGAHA